MQRRPRIALAALAAVLAAVLAATMVPAAADHAAGPKSSASKRANASQQQKKPSQQEKRRAQQRKKAEKRREQEAKRREQDAKRDEKRPDGPPEGERPTLRLACADAAPASAGGRAIRCEWSQAPADRFAAYRLFRAAHDGDKREPRVIHTTKDRTATTYTDTDVAKRNGYAYKVEALDGSGRVTAASGIVGVRPTEPPEDGRPAPMRLACEQTTTDGATANRCQWSPSDAPGFAAYRLWRAVARRSESGEMHKTEPAVVFRTTDRGTTSYVDRDVQPANGYMYRVETLDESGRVIAASEPFGMRPAGSSPPEGKPRPEPMRLACAGATSDDGPAVACRWSRSEAPAFAAYRLWRKAEGAEPTVIATITARDSNAHLDRAVENGKTYGYKIDVVDAEGRTIGHSDPVMVTCCSSGERASAA